MNQTREKRIESRERSILFLVVSSRARHRNGNAFEISTPSSPSPPPFHRFPRRRNPAFIPPPLRRLLLALPLPPSPPPSRRRQAENKRRPFISGAYIIRFFTRPASPRMTNWNNNNGYILHGVPAAPGAAFEIHLLPLPETQSNPVGQEEDRPHRSSLSPVVN